MPSSRVRPRARGGEGDEEEAGDHAVSWGWRCAEEYEGGAFYCVLLPANRFSALPAYRLAPTTYLTLTPNRPNGHARLRLLPRAPLGW